MELTEKDHFVLGGILHNARMEECFGAWEMSCRPVWPKTFKEFRGQYQAGQSWIDQACAQAKAIASLLDREYLTDMVSITLNT